MPSINRRLAIGTGCMLAIVVLVLGTAVNFSVHKRAEDALELRLQGLIYGLLGATDVQDDGTVVFNETELPDPELITDGTDLYAQLIGNLGQVYWESESRTPVIPDAPYSNIGEWRFTEHTVSTAETSSSSASADESTTHTVYQLQLTILWELINGDQLPFIVRVVSDANVLNRELAGFRTALWSQSSDIW